MYNIFNIIEPNKTFMAIQNSKLYYKNNVIELNCINTYFCGI